MPILAYWSFNDPLDPGHDDSEHGHDGTLVGAPTPPEWHSPGYLSFESGYVDVGEGVMTYGAEQDFMWQCAFRPSDGPHNPDGEILMSRRRHVSPDDEINMQLTYLSDGRVHFMFGSNQDYPYAQGWSLNSVLDEEPNEDGFYTVTALRDTTAGEFRMRASWDEEWVTDIDRGWDMSAEAGFGFGQERWQTSQEFQFHGDMNWVKVLDTPEPATLSLLALGGLAVIRRRR